ncbi:cysteine desulfurase family protein [Tepidimicrobium xylanilyticum]|uniref:Cysteine desulfurase n=1 Tax=Tepidimicrobium xylanilyticum TaxID=1123352 RepID=A0A1H2U083_9FIRM|nr:cysteine desulfurase family protein [Tepidimicrobium xylanilyticum]GMG98056.1 cysteine desulfurase [Tepidimicrobium xylanilyticum]SDW48969.1 cysteine desulfurase [Tepidimicrobium xylanilyticum]
MNIYLDNCSTTKPREEVIEEMVHFLRDEFANPSSLHRLGFNVEKKIEKARENIANFLNVKKDEIYFTSGGTESNNMAIQSVINKYNRFGKHIITSTIEHSSVLNVLKHYEENGYDITYLEVDNRGFISLEQLKDSLRDDTILISIMFVNNEIGTIQPIWEIKKLLTERKLKALLHVDGVQAFGKIPIKLKEWKVDTFSFSGHKIHGPKGVGGLYVRNELKLNPIIYGGNQERGFRSGTENVPGIMGLNKAVEIMRDNFYKEREHVRNVKAYFVKRLIDEIENIHINTPLDDNSSPYILNVSFEYVRGEVLLHYLEDKGIYVSTSSACSSKGTEKSHVLKALGLPDRAIEGTIRFCFSYDNTIEDMEYTVKILKDSVEEIRQITMR